MVHATHLTPMDIELLGASGTTCCICPSTEADLGDGIGPAVALSSAGSALSLGSDSHAMIDILTEARLLEWFQRLATGRRGVFSPYALTVAATSAGHASLGWPNAGRLTPSSHADLVTISLTTPRTTTPPILPTPHTPPVPSSVPWPPAPLDEALARVVLAATAADIRHVVVDGRDVVRDGRHLLIPDLPGVRFL
jgi:cytosine/adenosine deaminase-related metal-dependent hydrolase